MALAAGLVAAYGEPGVVQLKVPTYLIGAGNGSVLLSGRYLKEFEEAGAHVLPSTSQLPLHQSRIAVIFGACPQALGVPRAVMDAMIPALDMVLADGCPLRTLGSAFGNANIVRWAAAPRQATMSPAQAAAFTADRVAGLRNSELTPNVPPIKRGESSVFRFLQTTKTDGTISRGVAFGGLPGPVPLGAAFAGQPALPGNVWSIVERINAMEGSTGQAVG